ncbi:hypothetical protein glysoja_049293, partial [Glycine soja]
VIFLGMQHIISVFSKHLVLLSQPSTILQTIIERILRIPLCYTTEEYSRKASKQVVKHGNNIRCSSLELASLNARNKSAAAECYTRTEVCLEELMDDIRENVSVLTLLAEVLCLLDMIVNSFAHMISTKPVDRYTRPEFTENGPLAIDSKQAINHIKRKYELENMEINVISINMFLINLNLYRLTKPLQKLRQSVAKKLKNAKKNKGSS